MYLMGVDVSAEGLTHSKAHVFSSTFVTNVNSGTFAISGTASAIEAGTLCNKEKLMLEKLNIGITWNYGTSRDVKVL